MTPEKLQRFFTQLEEVKKTLPEGPWMHEEHRLEFKHNGFDCLLQRQPTMFHWCGYVGVPKGHPFFGKTYDEVHDWKGENISDVEIDVHGGLTYSDKCHGVVCHVTDDNDEIWWLGFDCAHAYDLSPIMLKFRQEHPVLLRLHENFENRKGPLETYRDVNFVTEETIRLAEQLSKIA